MTDKTPIRKLIEAVEAGNDIGVLCLPFDVRKCNLIDRSYYGSLDAALALHEAMLPGWGWAVEIGVAYVWHPETCGISRDGSEASTPARAWLLAILRAYEAQQ